VAIGHVTVYVTVSATALVRAFQDVFQSVSAIHIILVNKDMSTLKRPPTRCVSLAVRITVISGVAYLFFLLLPLVTPLPPFPSLPLVASSQELTVLLLLVVGFLTGFIWGYNRIARFHSESKINESKGYVYVLRDWQVFGTKMNLIFSLLFGATTIFFMLILGLESFWICIYALWIMVLPGLIGVTSATLFWEKRNHLLVYQRKIETRQWLIYFTKGSE